MSEQRPKVGVGVAVIRDGKVLVGKRKNAHGEGTWAFPGGHLEYGETLEDCARREVAEETGLKITNIRHADFTNDIFVKEDKHYVTLYLVADCAHGEPEVKEPDKCEGWEWYAWEDIPKPIFLSMEHLIEQGYNPFRLS